ncbi:ROK family protein [Paenibacillus thermoaerophilus]|uniref:ROK family protein n=1 Tax=Paenibacillus thermoaerophilus TaxID=1215385 RepID=A0ABW2V197_9BACL|nr:ROK family protein [Paenibacillus thermoaerophilus]TMV10429.1 ROK family protein [Paenibacillus thermoaerophilus]
MGSYAFGFDVGGTNIECGLVGREGSIVWRSRVRTEPERGNEHVMSLIAGQALQGLRDTGIPASDVSGIGIGMPGLIDPKRGVAILSANLFFRNYPVAAQIAERTGLRVCVENDVRLYVYGESLYGAGRNYRHVLGLTIGTGLAAAFVQDGRLYSGSGYSGEIGHIPVDTNGRPCGCGLTGCLETVVSAPGIVRQAIEALADGGHPNSPLRRKHADPSLLTARDLSEAYDEGDALAAAIMERTGRLLGRTLSYLVPMLSPDAIVIGGGVAQAGERLLGPVKEALYANIMPVYRDRLAFAAAELGDDAGILGSARWAFERTEGEGERRPSE